MQNDQPPPVEQVNLPAALGADEGYSIQCFTIYVPNKDQLGAEIGNQRKWVLEALKLLTELNGGASGLPPVEGGWRGNNGVIIWESPVIVYSFIDPVVFFKNLPRVREFLHRMGRETNQGEVAFEFDGSFFRIHTFDSA
jgi:hypothetical protein